MLWQRLLFGSLMIVAVVAVVVLDGWLSARAGVPVRAEDVQVMPAMLRGLPITVLVVLLVAAACMEMGRLARGGGDRGSPREAGHGTSGGYRPATSWATFVAAGLVLVPWMEMQQRTTGAMPAISLPSDAVSLTALWLAGGFLGAGLVVLLRRTTARALGDWAVTGFIILYLGLLPSFVVHIRCLDPGPAGAALFVFFILCVKSGDIGAYFTGRAIGRTKLAPWVSPGKTVEGLLGALVFGAVVAMGLTVAWERLVPGAGPAPLSVMQASVFGLVMAIVGHLGDLVESAIKRDLGSKDSGRVVPAFGGLLDLFDSPVFAAPVAWMLLTSWVRLG